MAWSASNGSPTDRADADGALDIVAIYIGEQAAHQSLYSRERKDGLTMPYQDLRAFLTALKDSGELVDIARPVAFKYDIAKALAKTSSVEVRR